MIVRVMGEGQYRVPDDHVEELNALDEQAGQAVDSGDEETLRRLLGEMAKLVQERGEPLDAGDLTPSEAMVPPDDLSLEEARSLFEAEGLIPDLPAPS